MLKDAHVRYEGDLQRTVASLQDQYSSALELLQLGAGLAPPAAQPKAELNAPSQQPQPAAGSSFTAGAAAGCCTGIQRPPCTRPVAAAGPCRCQRATSYRGAHAAAAGAAARSACCAKQATQPRQPPESPDDPRLSLLGLSADDFVPSATCGACAGLAIEPLAVLRDVLNLDGSRERELLQQRQQPSDRPLSAGAAAGPAGPLLAQEQFESRLRGAYRSMLLQLQHRYQLERERQEDAHKAALQEQESRHVEELQQLAAAQEADLGKAARRLERHDAARWAEVQRLEAQLAAAKAAAETSQGQAAAARAAAEALQAQLQLLRTTHEAELQHVRQGSIPLEEHEEIVRKLKTEWEQALQQRERDYSSLLGELADMRRQLSNAAEPLRSSGNSCGRGSTVASPLPATAAGSRPAEADGADPDAPATRQHHSSCEPESARDRHAESGAAADQRPLPQQQPPRDDPYQAQHHTQQPSHEHDLHDRQTHHHSHNHHRHQHREQPQEAPNFGGVQYVPVTTGGLRVRFEEEGGGGRPGSPGGSPHSAAARSVCGEEQADADEAGSAALESSGAEGSASSTPRSRAHRGPGQGRQQRQQPAGAADPPPPRPSSSSSRLSELVGAVVQYGSTASRRVLSDGAAEGAVHPSAAAAADRPGLDSFSFGDGGGGGRDVRSSGEDFCGYPQQQQQHRHAWGNGGGTGSGSGREVWGRGNICAGGGHGGDGPNSPDQQNSDITLGRWQREAPLPPQQLPVDGDGMADPDGWAAVSSQHAHPGHHPGQASRAGGLTGSAADLLDAALNCRSPPRTVRTAAAAAATAAAAAGSRGKARVGAAAAMGLVAGTGAGREADGARRRGRSPSPPRQMSPLSSLRAKSSWGRTGNPAAAVVLPRCLRCGLNDATSPGCCRFHPALLVQPGGLRFTPEWMTCQAAGHTSRTPGCFLRTEHFYEPGLPLQQQYGQQQRAAAAAPPATAAARRQAGGIPTMAAAASRRGSVGGEDDDGDGSGGGINSRGREPPAELRERRSSGGVRAAPVAAAGVRAGASPLRRSAPARSPGRGAARARGIGAGGGGAVGAGPPGVGAVDSSPSPKPRTRLPSPMRR